MNIEETIRRLFHETLESLGREAAGELSPQTVLLQSGLDSLGFAVLVSRLDEELGYDPFVLMTEAVYPRTLEEFVAIYEKHRPQ